MAKRIILIYLLVLTTPVWLYVLWLLKPKEQQNVFILDKTVADHECREHRAFNWILNHMKVTKPDKSMYEPTKDYFGVFPVFNDKDTTIQIRSVDHLNSNALMNLASQIDICYFNDTYGIYDQDLLGRNIDGDRSRLLYGGTSEKEVAFLAYTKYYKTLILLEFNLFASPTSERARTELEDIIGLNWSGWTGRYFSSLDTSVAIELPNWVVDNYLDQNDGNWPFKKDGIVLVNNWSRVVVLEQGEELRFPVPKIVTKELNQKKYGLPDTITYPFWFEISSPKYENVDVFSKFVIETTERGDSLLDLYDLPKSFPAIYENITSSKLYYFAADFSDVEVSLLLSRLKYIEHFDELFVQLDEKGDRKLFFWKYYLPLIKQLVQEKINDTK